MKLEERHFEEFTSNRFGFYKSFYTSIMVLDEPEQEELLKAIIKFGLFNEEPKFSNKNLLSTFNGLRENIISNKKKSENGIKGKQAQKAQKEKVIFAE